MTKARKATRTHWRNWPRLTLESCYDCAWSLAEWCYKGRKSIRIDGIQNDWTIRAAPRSCNFVRVFSYKIEKKMNRFPFLADRFGAKSLTVLRFITLHRSLWFGLFGWKCFELLGESRFSRHCPRSHGCRGGGYYIPSCRFIVFLWFDAVKHVENKGHHWFDC